MTGAIDPLYVAARRVLLDALDALSEHRTALVLVGAQAIYLRTGDTDLAIAPTTTDADLALNVRLLADEPTLGAAMTRGGFSETGQPGIWLARTSNVTVDLLVPDADAGPGRRGARLSAHGKSAARRAAGLEAAMIDRDDMVIASFEAEDERQYQLAVAGPGALLVAKLHKLGERFEKGRSPRLKLKDALDIFRLLRGTPIEELTTRMRRLQAECIPVVIEDALAYLEQLFASPTAPGSRMVAEALEGFADPVEITLSIGALAAEVLDIRLWP